MAFLLAHLRTPLIAGLAWTQQLFGFRLDARCRAQEIGRLRRNVGRPEEGARRALLLNALLDRSVTRPCRIPHSRSGRSANRAIRNGLHLTEITGVAETGEDLKDGQNEP